MFVYFLNKKDYVRVKKDILIEIIAFDLPMIGYFIFMASQVG